MKIQVHGVLLFLAIAALILTAGCTGTEYDSKASTGNADNLYSQAQYEMKNDNYKTASSLYEEAWNAYKKHNDSKKALAARNGMFLAERAAVEFPFNRTEAAENMKSKIPGITDSEIGDWLENSAQKIKSGGETLYFAGISQYYLYKNFKILQNMDILDFGSIPGYAITDESTPDSGKNNPYINPIRYTGSEKLEVQKDLLPKNGTLKIWFPLPVETDSQRNVSVRNLSYPEYVVKEPVTTGDIGYIYYEIPAEKIDGNLTIAADIKFTSYEQRFIVDPERVEAYNKSSPEYIKYTASERNIEISGDIRDKAKKIVGNETNPYLMAQLIYDYITTTYPYSHAPHVNLDTVEPKTPESTYMFETGHGDCGTQSILFSALCRAVGIPARAIGGYQMLISGEPGTHFWAEYYIEGYGWVPCDITVADVADWVNTSDEKRDEFKKYYSSNLDPTRYIIQKNVDAEMSPEFSPDAVALRIVRQTPAIVCDTAVNDLDLLAEDYFTVDLKPEE
ncbi:transglutaminase-like putative cysteine protease [Methanomicrobium sp. W14]|uniref:transglutaminase domain-containing protein n=1 Tax=Methanomicrobium sp. W14 TaxID=2817839 RepID=UPI001AE4C775|nr:transglutaminase domain-containing protein [Methanomicrobium sp. W14]MBP2132375.1 transglutaminase-like putative cysteine protease [Methanomicrobium sp. W14]